eukprot:tig00000190_g13879.t1
MRRRCGGRGWGASGVAADIREARRYPRPNAFHELLPIAISSVATIQCASSARCLVAHRASDRRAPRPAGSGGRTHTHETAARERVLRRFPPRRPHFSARRRRRAAPRGFP